MRNTCRSRGLWLLLLPLALGACKTEGGYDKVAYREREDIPLPATPNPPPVVPGAGAAAGGGAGPDLASVQLPAGVTPEMVQAGQQAYGTICGACHGPTGGGTPIAPALNDAQWLNISGNYDEIVTIINNGVPQPKQYPAPMPPKGGGSFDEQQVRALAAYVFALSHAGGQ